MQTLSSLSGSELLKRTQDLVVAERRTTMELIEHLREIERRMLFLETGHSSLFEFAVKHLGLSEGSAQRRISAMVRPERARDLTGESPVNKGRNLML